MRGIKKTDTALRKLDEDFFEAFCNDEVGLLQKNFSESQLQELV